MGLKGRLSISSIAGQVWRTISSTHAMQGTPADIGLHAVTLSVSGGHVTERSFGP